MAQKIINGIEELRGLIGQEVGVTDWFAITQGRINAFADATEDDQWIHVDTERARKDLPAGKTIAHGFLTLALISHLVKQAVLVKGDFKRAINYGLNRVRFPAPVPEGALIRCRCVLKTVEDVQGGIQLYWDITVEIEAVTKPAMVAEWLVRYYR